MKSFQTAQSKISPGIWVNRVKIAKLFTSYSGEAFLLHSHTKEVISMIMIFKQDTRIILRKRIAAVLLYLIQKSANNNTVSHEEIRYDKNESELVW